MADKVGSLIPRTSAVIFGGRTYILREPTVEQQLLIESTIESGHQMDAVEFLLHFANTGDEDALRDHLLWCSESEVAAILARVFDDFGFEKSKGKESDRQKNDWVYLVFFCSKYYGYSLDDTMRMTLGQFFFALDQIPSIEDPRKRKSTTVKKITDSAGVRAIFGM